MISKPFNLLITFLLITLLTTSCIHSSKRNFTADQLTHGIIASIKSTNAGLKSFKGLGSVKLRNNNQESFFRLAWAGENPDRLRLIILISGKKIESFAANEDSFYLKSYTGAHDFIKRNSKNASLERLVSIPVRTNDIIRILSGKIPFPEYDHAKTLPGPDNQGYIIELSKPWWGGVAARIFLDANKQVTGYETVKFGNSVYSVSFSDYKTTNGFRLPYKILIKSEDADCRIKISNYYTNPPVEPEMFSLQPD